MESWALVLIVIAAIIVVGYVGKVWIQIWARHKYQTLKVQSPISHCDIDTFVNNHKVQNPVNAVKCVLSHQIQIGNHMKHLSKDKPIPLEFYESSHVPGLYVSQRQGGTRTGTKTTTTATATTYDWDTLLAKSSSSSTSTTAASTSSSSSSTNTTTLPIVVCTIRMGFGHHRLAYSVSSWAMSTGRTTIFHDLLNIDSRTLFYFS
jgi:hypothetical protein